MVVVTMWLSCLNGSETSAGLASAITGQMPTLSLGNSSICLCSGHKIAAIYS
jgi:hypothetical protein